MEILEFRKMTSSTLKHKCGFINENANISRILSRNTKHCFNCSRMSVAYKPEFIKEEIDKLTNGEYIVLSDYQKENIPVLMRHNKCGHEWKVIRRNFVYRNTRCPKCSILTTRSKGCDFLTDYFKKNNIKFEIEKTFDECKSKRVLPFDFYLDSRNLLIEYDGEMHFHKRRDDDKEYTLQKLRDTHKHDLIKNEFCKNNNINLLRFPYDISNGDIGRVLDEYFEFENIGSTTIESLNIYFNDENNSYYDNRYSEE
jgi:very-short-patch-repair endonuclease